MSSLDRSLSRLVKSAGLVLMLGTILGAIGLTLLLLWNFGVIP